MSVMQNLDFDFEKCCVVSLSPINVYACLVCGKYFQVRLMGLAQQTPVFTAGNRLAMMLQGRGPKTNAFTHSLETNHHMFMKLENGKVGIESCRMMYYTCWFHCMSADSRQRSSNASSF